MPTVKLSRLLKTVLIFDAATCFLMGILLLTATEYLATFMQLPVNLLSISGEILCVFAAFVLFTGTRLQTSSAVIWAIILLNAVWTLASFATFTFIMPNEIGTAFIIAQALAVAGLVFLEYVGLKGSIAEATAIASEIS